MRSTLLDAAEEVGKQSSQVIAFAARPLAWLSVAAGGLMLVGVGVTIDAYRYNHGAGAAQLLGSSNPGFLVALAGFALAAVGLLTALTLLAFQGATSDRSFVLRGLGVFVAWIVVAGAGLAGVTSVGSGLIVGHSGEISTKESVALPTPTATQPESTEAPGVRERATLQGTLTVDGQPLQARFLGAHVVRDGLITACQAAIPGVDSGRYEIPIMADAEGRGCGAPGGRVVLWTTVGDRFLYSHETAPWPGSGGTAIFDASFSTSDPAGADQPLTAFKGHVVRSDGTRLGGGTLVEAFVGGTRCGVASVRYDQESWFTLLVAGPQVAGCAKDGRITFRVDGAGAGGTAMNDLGGESGGLTIEVTVG